MTEPEVPFEEKLASPEGTERTPRTSTSFCDPSGTCELAIDAKKRTTIVAAE
jgi:hypothetical protein